MTNAQRDLLRRAHKRLDASRYLHEGGFFDDAVSRAYYAMAHGAEAALLKYEMTPNTHKGLQTQFGKQFVKTGTFPPKMGRNLRRIFDLRQKADYSGADLTDDTVQNVIERAATFVQTSYLEGASDV
ncbi:hypothetical protein BSZ35_11250 [Salinibacter sp. 10B]|uniref:HEPN domain-containing protein n=1 Tax=Salinibacter sp. 10B TaxID=1923971 RepID=UPI000CF50FE3|nr:HEPN domain-containing protein [Salinibacter sp. 10B]PQJ35097.1 hypothetical protein BSZ35_11250 [Salinibacter sp. 10B]